MTWLTWRRQRAGLLAAAGFAVVMAAVVAGYRLFDVESLPCSGQPCPQGVYWGLSHSVLLLLPLVVGLLAGGALFAGELDRGTHVLVLTQGAAARQWWTAGLAVGGCAVVVVATAPATAVGWADADRLFQTPVFELSGVVPVAYALLVFAVAAITGLLTRSTIAAALVAGAVYVVVLFVLAVYARGHYLPPLVATSTAADGSPDVPDDAWYLGTRYLDGQGLPVPRTALYGPGAPCSLGARDCYARAGVATVEYQYQPRERYWPLQLIESAIVLGLAGVAVAVGSLRLRRAIAR